MIMNTYGLVRISSHIQSEKNGGTGVEFQSNKLSQYSTLNDFNLIKTITDVCSGGLETRDGIEELKLHIRNGEVDVVLIWNTSRVFRSMIHFSKFYEFLKEHNVELISVSEGIRSSRKEGEMMFGIMCSIAGYEKDLIRERMMSGKMTKLNKGIRSIGGSLPYGYSTDSKTNEIIVDEEEGKVVEYIFRKMNFLSKIKHLTPIKRTKRLLKLLKNRDFTYRDGSDFKAHQLRWILNNKFYIGEMKYGENIVHHKHPTIISTRLYNQIHI
jgi:DNA invertase Pin-like site-specific DNA recombinase